MDLSDTITGVERHFDLYVSAVCGTASAEEVKVPVPRLSGDKAQEGQSFDGGASSAKKRRDREVTPANHPMFVERDVAIRGKVVELDELIARLLQCRLRVYQRLVL